MSNANQKSALAAGLASEHHIYQLLGNNIGMRKPAQEEQPKDESCDTTYGDSMRDHEAAIRKADKKRARRNAKRLKNWNK